jgi:hypothetical protein
MALLDNMLFGIAVGKPDRPQAWLRGTGRSSMNERLRASGLNVRAPDGSLRTTAPGLPVGDRSRRGVLCGGAGRGVPPRSRRWSGEDHPLDALSAEVLAADPDPPPRRWVLCGALEKKQPDFRTLAGRPGRIRQLSLPSTRSTDLGSVTRGVLHDRSIAPTGPLPDPVRAKGVPRPACRPASGTRCPSSAAGMSGPARASTGVRACHRDCASRVACPVGASHRYRELERLYHNNRVAAGRPSRPSEDRGGRGQGWGRIGR